MRKGETAIGGKPLCGAKAPAQLVWTLFSAVVGAGFATGRELVLFFSGCPPSPVPWLLVSCLLIGVIAARDPAPGRASGAPGHWERAAGRLSAAAGMCLSWVTLVAMEAALAHLVAPRASWPAALIFSAFIIWAGAFWPAARGLGRLAQLLGPFIALAVVALSLWALVAPFSMPPDGFARPAAPGPARSPTLSRCALQAALYAASNGLFARVPLLTVAAATGQAPLPPALGAGALLAATAASTLWLVARFETSHFPMPLVEAAFELHPWAYRLHVAVVTASVYTTAVAAVVGLSQRSETGLQPPGLPRGARTAVCAFWVLTALPAAAPGFAPALGRFYPLAGWVALAATGLELLFASLRRRGLY